MNIAILGTGAIGSLFAVGLSKNHDVTCIVKTPAHADAINWNGIRIVESDGTKRSVPLKAITDTSDEKPADLVLIAVKSQNTRSAVESHKSVFGKNTVAVSLQNGYGNHTDIAAVVPEKQIIIGTTSHGANISPDGQINHAGTGETTIGALIPDAPGAAAMLTAVSKILTDAGFHNTVTGDAQDAVIRKLFVNVGINALCTLNDCSNKYISSNTLMREQSRLLVEEAVRIFEIAGRSYDKSAIVSHVISVAEKTGNNICSMLQDMRQGRETEIRRINGAVADLAYSLDTDAPLNREITNRIQTLTARRRTK